MKDINKEDRAYLAGLLDGEGCITIQKSNINEKAYYKLLVSFGLTYAPVLYEMKKLFGGNVYKEDMEKFKICTSSIKRIESGCSNIENNKQVYRYHILSKEAWVFLKIVEPYCKEKKEQVKLGIEFFNGKTDGRNNRGLSKSQVERCEYYYNKLRELKKLVGEEDLVFNDSQQTFSLYLEK